MRQSAWMLPPSRDRMSATSSHGIIPLSQYPNDLNSDAPTFRHRKRGLPHAWFPLIRAWPVFEQSARRPLRRRCRRCSRPGVDRRRSWPRMPSEHGTGEQTDDVVAFDELPRSSKKKQRSEVAIPGDAEVGILLNDKLRRRRTVLRQNGLGTLSRKTASGFDFITQTARNPLGDALQNGPAQPLPGYGQAMVKGLSSSG